MTSTEEIQLHIATAQAKEVFLSSYSHCRDAAVQEWSSWGKDEFMADYILDNELDG